MKISDLYREVFGDYLFHYTHINNQKDISNKKVLYSTVELRKIKLKPTYITDENSRRIDMERGFNEYVFLVFTENHPFIQKQLYLNINIVSVSIDISILDVDGVRISDRVATDNNVKFYSVLDAYQKLGIDILKDSEDKYYLVKKFEILIPNKIDLKKYYRKRI